VYYDSKENGGGGRRTVIFLLPSEIIITLEVLTVRSAVAVPSDFKV